MGLVPCLLAISVCPAACLLFFPIFRLPVCPGPLSFARFCLPTCPARWPFWYAPVCPFCPCGVRALPSAHPPGQWASWPPPASEKWQRSSSQTNANANSAARCCPFCAVDGPGCLLARAIAAAAVPSFRPSSCALSHSLSLSLSFVESVACVPILVLSVFCKNEVCRRRRREKKVGSSLATYVVRTRTILGLVFCQNHLSSRSPRPKQSTNKLAAHPSTYLSSADEEERTEKKQSRKEEGRKEGRKSKGENSGRKEQKRKETKIGKKEARKE